MSADALLPASIFVLLAGIAWEVFKPGRALAREQASRYWAIVYQERETWIRSTIHVLDVNRSKGHLTAWCYAIGREKVLTTGQFVKARDLVSCHEVDVAEWMGGKPAKAPLFWNARGS